MIIDFLIVGQGITGSFLSYYFYKEGSSLLVIDNNDPQASSRVAAGIINPVTGRRLVKTWMIDELIPFVHSTYTEFGNELGIEAIGKKEIVEFFPNPASRLTFLQRMSEDDTYLAMGEENAYREYFNYEFGYGIIKHSMKAELGALLTGWRNILLERNMLVTEDFNSDDLVIETDKLKYRDITARKIIFCDGISSFSNPWFRHLPFAFNKGEALIVEIPGMTAQSIFKKSIHLVSLNEKELFWAGSGYTWKFEDDSPTLTFREQTGKQLKSWLIPGFRVLDHKAGIRPATIERRPFVGLHPLYKNIGIVNGMGTKGCSLAPYFAKQMTDHLLHGKEINTEASVLRFSRLLSKT